MFAESNYDPRMAALWLGCLVAYGIYCYFNDRNLQ